MGGAIHYNFNRPTIINNTFSNNSAPYGNNVASYPSRIGFINSEGDASLSLEDIASGKSLSQALELGLFDMDGQIISLDSTSTIIILPKNASISSARGTNVELVHKGIATFDGILFSKNNTLNAVNFTITSSSINTQKVSSIFQSTQTQDDLIINFRN